MASPAGYSRTQIVLHWLIAILIGLQYLSSDLIEEIYDDVLRGEASDVSGAFPHVLVGFSILVLAIWRLVLRLRRGAPDLPPGGHPLQDRAARWTHRLLYALTILLPLAGMAAWGGGIEAAGALHGSLFWLFALLIFLHVVAAIWHQWVLKDGLIGRMMKAR